MNNLLIKRILATALDILIVSVPTLFIALIIQLLRLISVIAEILKSVSFPTQLLFLYFCFYFLYDYFYMTKFRSTIGKRKFHIHVENERGKRKLLQKTRVLRSLYKSISLFGFYSVLSIISIFMMTTNFSTSIHDKLVRTAVWENTNG